MDKAGELDADGGPVPERVRRRGDEEEEDGEEEERKHAKETGGSMKRAERRSKMVAAVIGTVGATTKESRLGRGGGKERGAVAAVGVGMSSSSSTCPDPFAGPPPFTEMRRGNRGDGAPPLAVAVVETLRRCSPSTLTADTLPDLPCPCLISDPGTPFGFGDAEEAFEPDKEGEGTLEGSTEKVNRSEPDGRRETKEEWLWE